MKKLTLLFAAAAMLFAGCVRVTNIFEQVDGRLDALENRKIPDIEEQIDAINASLENLSTMDKELKGYIEELTATAEGLKEQIKATNTKLDEVKSALQNEVSSAKEEVLEQLELAKSELVDELSKIDSAIALLQSKDSELEHKIAELRSYVNDELGKATDWVSATFATLDQYNALVDEVASVKSQIASVNDSIALLESKLTNKINDDIAAAVSSLNETIQQKVNELTNAYIEAVAAAKSEITAAYTSAIQSAIANLDNSLRAWVGEQLAGYYTIAEVDSKIEALLLQLGVDDASLMEELNGLKEQLKSTAADITAAYKKAIEEAIASNGGEIDSKQLEAINNRIDTEIATINGKLAELQKQVDKNTADIAKLLARIQSVSYVPRYSDGKATVKFESDSSEVVFDFEVSPKDAVAELATVWQSAVSVKAVYTQTRAVSFVEMPILKFEADAENGVISVFASGENLSQDFKDGKLEASARLAISDGNNTLTSDYVPMVAKVMPPYVLETTFDSQKINGKIFIRSRIAQDSNPLICVDYGDGNLGLFTEYTYSKSGEYSVKFYFNNPITEIAHSAFFGSCLTSVIIPNSVTIIGNLAFASTGLQNVKFEGNSQLMHINDGAFQYTKIKKINLPPSVEYVGNCVFSGSPYLTEITGGGSKFGYMQGMYCEHNNGTSYTVIAYPAALEIGKLYWTGVTYDVKWGAFAYCHNIVDIELRMNRIEQYNFMGCDNLQSIELGYTTSIANDVLRDCKSLRYIDAPLASSIGENTFCNNESLTDITLGCDELTTLSKVGNNNPALGTLWIPSGVTEINESFNSAPSLVNIYCKATTPPALTSSFDSIPAEAKIYVPWTSVSAYKAAEGWHDHEDKIVGYNFETNEVVDDSELLPPSNQIWYTSTDGNIVEPYSTDVFGVNIVSNTYENGKGVITFDGDVTSIGHSAFYYCTSLASVIIPSSVTSVEVSAFLGATSMSAFGGKFASADNRCLVIDGTLVAFASYGLKEYIIPDEIKSIGSFAFFSSEEMINVSIPNSVTSIGDNAFCNCTSLVSVIIPEGVEFIGEKVFFACSSLKEIYCKPSTPPTLLTPSFDSIPAKTKIYVPYTSVAAYLVAEGWSDHREKIVGYDFDTNEVVDESQLTPANNQIWYTSENGDVVEPFKKDVFGANIVSNTYKRGKGVIEFDGTVTKVGDQAFRNSRLSTVVLPSGVQEIGPNAFLECNYLSDVMIPEGVVKIGNEAFRNTRLKNIIIPNSVTEIGDYVFHICGNLTSVTMSDNITKIGDSAFSWCDSIKEFNGKCASLDNRCLILNDTVVAFAPCGLTAYSIPYGVKIIGDGAFSGSRELKDVYIPNTVTYIDVSAFSNCGLTSVNIPDSVTFIEQYAFSGCEDLANVVIPNSVESIRHDAFSWCEKLTSITIPESVTYIESTPFNHCDKLSEFKGKYASADGRCLIYEGELCAFAPYGMIGYSIPGSVTSIGSDVFRGNTTLTSIVIPENVEGISACVFQGCSSLVNIYCRRLTPPNGGWLMFDEGPSNRKIYVPMASVDAYKSAEYWSEYADQIVGYNF